MSEWYELVGRRLRDVQDSPTRLDELSIHDGCLHVWVENQAVWSIAAPIDAGDDPRCRVDDVSFVSPDAPVSQTLLGMLVSDTLVGAWSGSRIGTLGELRATVRGGYDEDLTEEKVQRVSSAYAELDYTGHPFFDNKYRGDDTTIVRVTEVAVEWCTATDEAFASLDGVLGLMPEGGEHEVVAAFDAEAVTQQRRLVKQLPDIEVLKRVLAGVGRVGMAVMGGQPELLRFHIQTKQPRRVLDLVLAEVSTDLLPHLTVATRPTAVSVFEVLYPEGKARFVLPP